MTFPPAAAVITRRKSCGICPAILPSPIARPQLTSWHATRTPNQSTNFAGKITPADESICRDLPIRAAYEIPPVIRPAFARGREQWQGALQCPTAGPHGIDPLVG